MFYYYEKFVFRLPIFRVFMNKFPKTEKPFDFKRYQNLKKSRRMLVRFILYGIIIGVLIYLISDKQKASPEETDNADIENFEIESTEQQ